MSEMGYPNDVKLATIGGRPGTITIRDPIPIDSVTDGRQGVADGTGAGSVVFGPVQPGYQWKIERISVAAASVAASVATVYLDSVDPSNIVDYTPSGNNDVADELQPILVPEGSKLIVRWTGADANAVLSARAQYTIYVVDFKQLTRGQS